MLAYTFDTRTDEACNRLKKLLSHFNLTRYFTDGLCAIILAESIYYTESKGVDLTMFFTAEVVNAQNQTALTILLANKYVQFNATIKVFSLYCISDELSVPLREKIIVERKMDISGIDYKRKALDHRQQISTAKKARENTRALIKTNQLVSAQAEVIHVLEQKVCTLENQLQE